MQDDSTGTDKNDPSRPVYLCATEYLIGARNKLLKMDDIENPSIPAAVHLLDSRFSLRVINEALAMAKRDNAEKSIVAYLERAIIKKTARILSE